MTRFGPSGNDKSFYEQGYKASTQAPKWLKEKMGLNAFEINFARSPRMSIETAHKMGEEARKYDIELSAHAPYFVNLTNDDAFEKNYKWIRDCLFLLNEMGYKRLVVHLASQGSHTREKALEKVEKNLRAIIKRLDDEGLSNWLMCIETMGKYSYIGTLEEICALCKIDPRIIPTLDFGHLNCLEQGELSRNPNRIGEIIDYVEREIGLEKLKQVHIHFSAIVYGEKGERWHTTIDDEPWAIPFEPLANVIKEKDLKPVIICESADIMAQDAKRLKQIFEKI